MVDTLELHKEALRGRTAVIRDVAPPTQGRTLLDKLCVWVGNSVVLDPDRSPLPHLAFSQKRS
jgi:hypothetical protein